MGIGRHEHLEQGQTVCSVCESSGLKTSLNLLIKTDLMYRLREVIDSERLITLVLVECLLPVGQRRN